MHPPKVYKFLKNLLSGSLACAVLVKLTANAKPAEGFTKTESAHASLKPPTYTCEAKYVYVPIKSFLNGISYKICIPK